MSANFAKPDRAAPRPPSRRIKQKIDARTEAGEIDEVAQAKAQIAKAEADLVAAKYDLDGTTHLAPANGRVTNLALQPGVRATQFATMPVMSFIQEDDPWVLAYFYQNELRYVEPGNEAEIFLKTYPDRIIKCKVDSILWATAQGQMPISGSLQTTTPGAGLDQRIAVRLLVEPKDKDLFLAAGAVGAGAIYTEQGQDHPHHPQGLRARLDEDRLVRLEASLSRTSHEYPHLSSAPPRASRSPVARSRIRPPAPTSCPTRRARKSPANGPAPHRRGDVVPELDSHLRRPGTHRARRGCRRAQSRPQGRRRARGGVARRRARRRVGALSAASR